MALTPLEIKDKNFSKKMRGFDTQEVNEFLDIIVRDYGDVVRENQENKAKIKSLTEKLDYFDEMKESLSKAVIVAQDTAAKVKTASEAEAENILQQAEHASQLLLETAKNKANEILREATDNAKRVAVETEELKNKTRVFHQRLKSTIESQMAIVDSSEWEEILRPTATYLQTSDEAFKEVIQTVLAEEVHPADEEQLAQLDMTRQLTSEELDEINRRAEAANEALAEHQATQVMDRDEIVNAIEEVEDKTEEKTVSTESVDVL